MNCVRINFKSYSAPYSFFGVDFRICRDIVSGVRLVTFADSELSAILPKPQGDMREDRTAWKRSRSLSVTNHFDPHT